MANRSISKALSDTQIRGAKAKEKEYTLPDGDGLQLLIKSNGSKLWVIRYTLNGKARKTTGGGYPKVSLSQARARRDEIKSMAANGIDPILTKQEEKQQQETLDKGQFHLVVREWADNLTCSSSYAKKRYRAYERDMFSYFCTYDKHHNIKSSLLIADIKHEDLFKAIKAKEVQTPETAKRLYQDAKLIWEHAISSGYAEVMTPLKIKKSSLPRPQKKHYAKITDETILKELLHEISKYKGQPITRYMLQFVTIIPLRAENLCKLRWEQIDLDQGTLTIKRPEMKVKDANLPDFNGSF